METAHIDVAVFFMQVRLWLMNLCVHRLTVCCKWLCLNDVNGLYVFHQIQEGCALKTLNESLYGISMHKQNICKLSQ